MMRISKKLFLIVALGSINFVARPDVAQKESLEKFLASAILQGGQKEGTPTVKNLLNLFDKIVEGLQTGGEKLSQLTKAFYDLCAMLGQIDEPRPHHIRELESKLEEIYVLISNDKDVSVAEKAVIENISAFINLFEELLTNENLNLGGAVANFADLFFYRPLEFINQYKYGKEVTAATAAVVVASLGAVIAWRVSKSKETIVVVPTPTASSETGIELETFADLSTPVTPLPEEKPSENVEITPIVAQVVQQPTVPATLDPNLSVPSSTSGVDAQPVEKPEIVKPADSVPAIPATLAETQTILAPVTPTPVVDSSKPSLPRQNNGLGIEQVEQPKVELPEQEVVAPVAQKDRSTKTRYSLRQTKTTSYGAKKK